MDRPHVKAGCGKDRGNDCAHGVETMRMGLSPSARLSVSPFLCPSLSIFFSFYLLLCLSPSVCTYVYFFLSLFLFCLFSSHSSSTLSLPSVL